MADPRWEAIERELKRGAQVAPDAVDRIMRRVRAPAPPGRLARLWRWLVRPRVVRISPVGALAGASAVLLLVLLPDSPGETRRDAVAPAHPAAAGWAGEAQSVQFVLVAAEASQVALVGDFNDWNPRTTPMRRSGSDGLWSVVVPLRDGHYRYAFVVDGSAWVADAAAPRSPGDGLGGPRSVILVGESL